MSLTAADLAGMRSTLTASLPDRASIVHVTKVQDIAGGRTETTVTTAGVPCRFVESSQKKGGELVAVEVLTAQSGWLFTFPLVEGDDQSVDWTAALAAVIALDVLDRILIGSRTFDVEAVFPRSWELDRRVFCTERR